MRQRSQKQMYLRNQSATTRTSDELQKLEEIVASLPEYDKLLDLVLRDLSGLSDNEKDFDCPTLSQGRSGLTAGQVLKSFIVKHYKNCSYRELEDLTKDSLCVGKFLEIDPHGKGISYKTLQGNIKMLSEETIDFFLLKLSAMPKTKISRQVLKHARMPQE